MGWPTPDSGWGGAITRLIRIPAGFRAMVNGALMELIIPSNWYEVGDVVIDDAIALMQVMFFDYLESEWLMIGSIAPYATDSLPDGVLACDGAEYDREDYPDLYSVLESSLIVDANTFRVPDLRGRSILGTGAGPSLTTRAFGDTGGAETVQLTVPNLPSHYHTTHTHGIGLDVESAGVPDLSSSPPLPSELTGETGSDAPHENMHPYYALTWGIIAR